MCAGHKYKEALNRHTEKEMSLTHVEAQITLAQLLSWHTNINTALPTCSSRIAHTNCSGVSGVGLGDYLPQGSNTPRVSNALLSGHVLPWRP